MSTHSALHYNHKMADIAAMKNEIENMKTHYATKADMIKWVVGVGIATVLSVVGATSGLLFSMDTRLTHEIRETRQESRYAIEALSKKMDLFLVEKKR